MKDNRTSKSWFNNAARKIAGAFLVATAALALSGVASAQKTDVITFNLTPNPDTVGCLRANNTEEPRARATVVRGKVNDTLILDLDGIRPGLAFDLFTVQRSPLLADGSKDPAFTNVFNGSFGLAWYQSDIQVQHSDNGHVRIQTILLDDIFGFDPDVRLAPTNTFHVGFWFDDPNAAKSCGFDPTKPKPFNGEHKSGPLAMISLPDAKTGQGPLCTSPDTTTTPASCKP
ncbi:MAG: hypothetical protein ACXV5R_09690 [Candidatus Angelobacter sp.]